MGEVFGVPFFFLLFGSNCLDAITIDGGLSGATSGTSSIAGLIALGIYLLTCLFTLTVTCTLPSLAQQ